MPIVWVKRPLKLSFKSKFWLKYDLSLRFISSLAHKKFFDAPKLRIL